MAATEWNVSRSLKAGLSPTYLAVDTTNGNKFKNNGKVRLHFKGAASATGQMRIEAQKVSVPGGTLQHETTAASALDTTTEELVCGPFDPQWYAVDGYTFVSKIGTVTGITVSVIEDASL